MLDQPIEEAMGAVSALAKAGPCSLHKGGSIPPDASHEKRPDGICSERNYEHQFRRFTFCSHFCQARTRGIRAGIKVASDRGSNPAPIAFRSGTPLRVRLPIPPRCEIDLVGWRAGA